MHAMHTRGYTAALLAFSLIIPMIMAACSRGDDASLPDGSLPPATPLPERSEGETPGGSVEQLVDLPPEGPEAAAVAPLVPETDSGIAEEASPPAAQNAAPALQPEAETRAQPGELDAELIERDLLNRINQDRLQNGLEQLGLEESLRTAARMRAQEALDSLSHTRPDGRPYHSALSEAGFAYAGKWHGENLAAIRITGQGADNAEIAETLFSEWIESSGHLQNIRSEHFYQTGVGVHIREEDGETLIGAAQMFAGL